DDLHPRSLQADPRAERRVPDFLRPVRAPAARLHGSRRCRGTRQLPRDDLSRATGVEARPRAGAQVPMTMAFLEARALDKSYIVGTTKLEVLRGLDLTVEKGEMVAIVGASGVGKSTLLHVLGGLDAIDGGSIRIGDQHRGVMKSDALTAFRNRHVGFVFQFHHLLPEFTALENAGMPMRIARRSAGELESRASAMLARVGLAERVTHNPGMLSGGE